MFGGPQPLPPKGRRVHKIGEVLDQRNESACVGFGWTQFLQSDPKRFEIQGPKFDFALQVYRDAQKKDSWPGEEPEYFGTSVEAGHAVLRARGLVIEDLEWATSIGQIVQYIFERGPVVVGTEWLKGMQPDAQGYLQAKGASEGGHCWLIYGADSYKEEFLMVNSWGLKWGGKGRAKIKFPAMDTLIKRGGYGCSAIES